MATNDKFSHMPEPLIENIRQAKSRFRNNLEYQYFPEEYFTGADTTIYFGDTFVSDLTAISFSLSEPVKPVHGYASYTWDTAVRGARLVQGQFRIAFTEAGYLHTILDHVAQLKENGKPRLAFLMGGETVPNWVAGVKEDIEGLLERYHGNPNAKDDDRKENYTVDKLDVFEWDTLKLNHSTPMTDAKYPNKAGRKRQGSSYKDTKYLGQISQLQSRLIELGYSWPDWKWMEGSSKGKDISFTVAGRPSKNKAKPFILNEAEVFTKVADPKKKGHNDWLLIRRVSRQDVVYGGYAKYNQRNPWEVELQARLGAYPFNGLNQKQMGVGEKYDGRYGYRTAEGVSLFQQLAEIPSKERAASGDYLTMYVYQQLKQGLHVNGKFDVATMIAVKLFQKKNGLTADGIVGEATRKKLSPMVKENKTKNIPGESLYSPDKLYEPRAAQYEKEVWGRASSADTEHNRRTFFYSRTKAMEYLKEKGFDIYLTYGPYPEAVIGNSGQMAKSISGNTTKFNTTVKAIRNVQITGITQMTDTSGNPVEEVYSFLAQDLD